MFIPLSAGVPSPKRYSFIGHKVTESEYLLCVLVPGVHYVAGSVEIEYPPCPLQKCRIGNPTCCISMTERFKLYNRSLVCCVP